MQQIGLKHYDDFNERMARDEVEEIEARVGAHVVTFGNIAAHPSALLPQYSLTSGFCLVNIIMQGGEANHQANMLH